MMDGVVWNSKYFDPSAPDAKQMLPATGMRYIATREGVHIISPEEETAMELKNNFNYIARRKGVAHVDGERDGLFNAFGKADLSYECEQATQSGSIFWKNVLSLSKEDAERLGYNDVDAFRQLLARRMPEVAREYSISPQNLVWVAAYHPIDKNGADHHPHVHVYFYSKDPTEGRMSPERTVKAFEKCRSLFTNDVFAEDAALLKEQRTVARDELRDVLREYRFDSEAADKLGLRDDLRQLARELPAEGRKGAYKYLKPETKEKVDAILRKMVQLPDVDRAYTAYRDAYLAQVKLYNSEESAIAKRMDAFDKDFFHPTKTNSRRDFHNAILHMARDIEGVDVSLARREIGEPPRELKQFVGLSAREAVAAAQTNTGYREWLGRMCAEYSVSELPDLMKAAQRENWRELYKAVRSAANENPQLTDALVNECRLYLTADEQAQGAYVEGDRLYHAGVTETTADGVRAEAQRILYATRNVTDGTEDYVRRLFYENALDRRVQGWFQARSELVDELRQTTGLVLYRVDDKRRPCPKSINDAAYAASSELLIQIANDDPLLRKERDLFMVRSLKSDDFDGMDRVMNAALHTAYRQEISKMRYTLRQCYRPLLRQGDVLRSPAKDLVLPLAATKEVLPLTHKEQEAVEEACADDALGHLLIFLLWTGLRKGEMMALKWKDYNSDDNSIFVRDSKTEAGIRKVYLLPIAQRIVERMPKINEYIFNHTRNAPITPTVMRRLVDRIRTRSGVDSLTCHQCRHTFVTRLCEKGAPAKAIAQIIGHAKADYVLDIYAELEADELRKVIYVLDEKGERSKLMGANVTLPVELYLHLEEEAEKQHVSVDALATFLLTSVTAQK